MNRDRNYRDRNYRRAAAVRAMRRDTALLRAITGAELNPADREWIGRGPMNSKGRRSGTVIDKRPTLALAAAIAEQI